MRILKQISALLLAAALMMTLSGCGETVDEVAAVESALSLSVCMDSAPAALDPIYAESLTDRTILVHLYENLMRLSTDENGNTVVVNGMAKEWGHEENRDGTVTFTFHLRDAKWSDGTKVKASDFVYAWRRLANPLSHSPHAQLLSIVAGYDEARATGDMSLLQVIAKNDATLVVNLIGHYDWFQTEVCTSAATLPLRQDVVLSLKERAAENGSKGGWSGDPTALVTNGPYRASAYETNRLVLSAEKSYYESLTGPQEITFLYDRSEDSDFSFPMSEAQLQELLAADEPTPTLASELATHTVLFNGNHQLLGDPLIRQALSLAVNRPALAEAAGATARIAEGLVPFGVPENEEGDFRTASAPLLDTSSEAGQDTASRALKVLQNAGYNSGSDLGEMEYLYVDDGTNGDVARAICRQWEAALGLSVTPKGMTNQELWAALRSGEYALAGVELDADGNDAECFLMEWTSSSQNNVIGYANTAYDTLLAIIARAPHGIARLGCLHDAETLLLGDYALLPLYTHSVAWELREGLSGLCRDARGWFYFAEVTEVPPPSA